jgi:hypothetical protein
LRPASRTAGDVRAGRFGALERSPGGHGPCCPQSPGRRNNRRCAPSAHSAFVSRRVQNRLFWSIRTEVPKVAALQTARKHALTCTAAPSVTCFGTYSAQQPGQAQAAPNLRCRALAASPIRLQGGLAVPRGSVIDLLSRRRVVLAGHGIQIYRHAFKAVVSVALARSPTAPTHSFSTRDSHGPLTSAPAECQNLPTLTGKDAEPRI